MVTPSPQLAHCWQFVELCALVTGQKTPGELLLGFHLRWQYWKFVWRSTLVTGLAGHTIRRWRAWLGTSG